MALFGGPFRAISLGLKLSSSYAPKFSSSLSMIKFERIPRQCLSDLARLNYLASTEVRGSINNILMGVDSLLLMIKSNPTEIY